MASAWQRRITAGRIAAVCGPLAVWLLFDGFAVCPLPAVAEESPQAEELFEKQIRPLLVEHCQKCHGAKKQEGELRLDSPRPRSKGASTA